MNMALALYDIGSNRRHRTRLVDADLVKLFEEYPEMLSVLEELQYLRQLY